MPDTKKDSKLGTPVQEAKKTETAKKTEVAKEKAATAVKDIAVETAKGKETVETAKGTETAETAKVKETEGAGRKVGTSNEVFIELLPDERTTRHAALKMMRELGLGCSQARMAEILLEKYGPAPQKKSGSTSGGASGADRAAKEKIRLESEEKALAAVRAKRKEVAAGKEVEGYQAKPVAFEGGLEAAKKAEESMRAKEKEAKEAAEKAAAAVAGQNTDTVKDTDNDTDKKPVK